MAKLIIPPPATLILRKEDQPASDDSIVSCRPKTFDILVLGQPNRAVKSTTFRMTERNKSLIAAKMAGNGTDGERVKKTKSFVVPEKTVLRFIEELAENPRQLPAHIFLLL